MTKLAPKTSNFGTKYTHKCKWRHVENDTSKTANAMNSDII